MAAPQVPTGFVLDVEPEETQRPSRRARRRARSAPPVPTGFVLDQETEKPAPVVLIPNGQAPDGDTVGLTDGRNARLKGYDAFETGQVGRARDNSIVPLGERGRKIMADLLPGAQLTGTGELTYGRPVVTMDADGIDPGQPILREGFGIAEPNYLKDDPERRTAYMEAERLARLNRLGAHGGKFETPSQFRHKDGPWKAAEPGSFGEGEAVFWDEPTPFQGLRPEIAQGYMAIVSDPKSTKQDILNYAKQSGFTINEGQIDSFLKERAKPNTRVGGLTYAEAPQVLTDLGDGATGSFVRGFADPVNMLDELGGVVDSLGGTPGRESIWNSERRFGDVLWNNIDQNRSILGFDDANHPYARFGGQLGSGLIIPGASIEGIGAAAMRAALLKGATVAEARAAARTAVTRRLAIAGAVEGGVAGGGAGEGNIIDRLPGAALGAGVGATLGYGAGELGQTVVDAVKRARRGVAESVPRVSGRGTADIDHVLNGTVDPTLDGPAITPRGMDALERSAADGPVFAPSSPRVDLRGKETPELLDVVRRTLMEHSEPEWVRAVQEGAEAPHLREAYDRLRGVVDELGVRGVDLATVERDIAASLRGRGWAQDQIDDVMPERFANLRALQRSPNRLDVAQSIPGAASLDEGLGLRSGQPAIDTRQPVRPAPQPRDMEDVQGDIDAWARSQGLSTDDRALPEVMLHGSPNGAIDAFDPYARSGYGLFGTGTYLTDSPQVAASYSRKGIRDVADADRSIYAVGQSVRNPIDMDAPADRTAWAALADEHGFDVPAGATNEDAFRALESAIMENDPTLPKWEGAEIVSDAIRSMGHDGITHVGGGRVGNGPRHRVVIALDPEQTAIKGRLSVSDLLNPPAPRSPDWIDIAGVDMPRQVRGERDANMDAEGLDDLSISAPVREIDRIDVGRGPPPPTGFILDAPPLSGHVRPMDERPSPAELAAMAEQVEPGDITPIPGNAVESLEEAQAIGEGLRPPVRAGDERAELETRWLPSTRDPSRTLPRKGPLDLVSWLRANGGVKPQGGELAHMGIDNTPRALDFAQAENRLGRLVDADRGLDLDEAALRAWEAGYFPDHVERPTVTEFLDALGATHAGRNRSFRSEDLAEVDAFEAARRQRFAVEKAADEGRPLVDDLGQPITQSDLEANAPPVTAYEDLPKVGGRVGNIDLSKVETRHDIRRLLQTTEHRVGGFDAARRGRISQGETEALASELGMTASDLLKRRKGQALNAEEALAARQLLAKSSDELIRLAQRVDGGSDEEQAAFRQAWLRHVAIQEQVTGATAEAGRALAQFKMAARGNAVKGRVHAAMIEGSGGADRLKDAARAILDLQERGVAPGAVTKFAIDALKPKWSDKLVELWYNSILSGPQTHAVNILSNTITAALQLPEMAAAAAIGGARRAARLGDEDRVVARELGARTVGLLTGAREGLRAFGRTLKTGEVPDFVTKVEARTQKAISGSKGEVIRFPTRALAAEDELFKAIARRMEIAGLATRKATFEGLKGDALRARVDELIANPDQKMADMSLDYARYLTFQRPLGPAGQSVSRFTQNMPIAKLFLPFVRTPANIFKHVLERSPAAPFLKEWRADIKAGGAQRDLAIARASLGTGLGMLAAQLAADGYITGSGPMDQGAETFMRADGWQPYSVKIGDQYYSYQRLDPIASTLGVAADLATKGAAMTEKQSEESVTLLVASIMKNLSDKTWLSGMSDLVEALEDPERNAKRVVGRLAGSLAVPAIVGQAARTLDPTLRETRDPLDFVKARIPGLSDNLPAKRDVWGKEIVREGGVGPDIVSPIWTGTAKNDRLNSEMLAAGVRIGLVPRKVGGRDLTRAEHDNYRMLSGTIMESAMRDAIDTPEWKNGTPEDRQDIADDVKKTARKEARAALFGGYKKAVPRAPGLNMPADAAARLFPVPKGAPPPPTGFVLDN